MNIPFLRSRFKIPIERGLTNGSLSKELSELGEEPIKSRSDADVICWGLKQLSGASKNLGNQTYELALLFQRVDGRQNAAFPLMQEQGISELLRLFDIIAERKSTEDTNALFFILKIFALYGTVAGTLKIIEMARLPFQPEGHMWHVVLRSYTEGHPEKDLLYNSLRDPLPPGFIAVSLLDASNKLLIGGVSMTHPFDSAEGKRRLRTWLTNSDPEEYSYAHSATAALPFLSNPERDSLLILAMDHPGPKVRAESAWAAAKLGQAIGYQHLVEFCKDLKTSDVAKRYLTELGREDLIPASTNEPGFSALATFGAWCEHPNELGRFPDELEIVDHRELRWPPERKPKPFWLIKYKLRDNTGLEDDNVECGLVGSITFCFFSRKLHQRPPEDAYAIHCYWEMEKLNLIEESDVGEKPAEYESLLAQWAGPAAEVPELRFVAELSPELGHTQRLLGLASAKLNGEAGWIVLDGPRSEWYPQRDQPAEVQENLILQIHVGRQLLGFTGKLDRRSYLAPEPPTKPAEHVISAYETLLAKAQLVEGKKQRRAFSFLRTHFDKYVAALMSAGKIEKVRGLVDVFGQRWQHWVFYSILGTECFKAGEMDLAEEFLTKYREHFQACEKSKEMTLLAEVWHRKGRSREAQELLVECLSRIVAESKMAKEGDFRYLEERFQGHLTTFLRLFPDRGREILEERLVPSTILRRKSK